ncbi:glycosyltransferase family A protein [Nocardioides sp.]|uniref:glycosyltransferase family A protein n=1 Tax=Nocardioides sp. TaxID=35761 RepID=UPI00262E211E|nr:glycosyltransferase family A protein [Nocardioides sp.]MCW2738247.1 glycosyl transferase [Nocardioides sp.]
MPPYVREALASVASQSLDSFELVVNDDASSDDSVEVINRALADLGLEARTVFHDSRRGICATFNEALDLIRTPFVAFLAADDVMGPTGWRRSSRLWTQHPTRPSPTATCGSDSLAGMHSSTWTDLW